MAEGRQPHRLNAVDVWLGEVPVGRIMRAAGGGILFTIGEAYAELQRRPILSQCYELPAGKVSTAVRVYPGHLPPFFENLLPEGPLKQLLARRANVDPNDQLSLLGALGEDLPGAVKVVRASQPWPSTVRMDDAMFSGTALRFSLAGVQLKLSTFAGANGTLTVPAMGAGGSWIVKLPAKGGWARLPENEYAMMTLAKKVGIPVPHVEVVPMKSIAGLPHEVRDVEGDAFAVKRFDRKDGGRVHMEDFAQVFGVRPEAKYAGHSYANIADVLATVSGQQSVADFVDRVMFSALIGNGDMHLKNWTLLYAGTNPPALSPAYDFVSTIPYLRDDDLALGFGGSKDFFAFDRRRIEKFSSAARIPIAMTLSRCRTIAEKTMQAWKDHEERGLLPARDDALIDAMIQAVARNVLGGHKPLKRHAIGRIKAPDLEFDDQTEPSP